MVMSPFQSFKHEVVQFAALSKDALHIYVGLIIFLVVAAIARKGLRSGVAVLAVLVVAVAGEVLDLRDEWHSREHLNWWASIHDLVNTCFWPLVLWLLARYTRIVK
jgi:hypothetical protein